MKRSQSRGDREARAKRAFGSSLVRGVILAIGAGAFFASGLAGARTAIAQDGAEDDVAQEAQATPEPTGRQATAADGAQYNVREIGVAGLGAWGVDSWDQMQMRVRLAEAETGLVADSAAPVRTLRQIVRGARDGVSMHESALREVAAAIPGWMLESLGVDYGGQRVPPPIFDPATGVVTFTVDPPGPGVGEGSNTYRTMRIEGATGKGLSEEDILNISIDVYGVGNGYIAARRGLPSESMPLSAIQDPRIRLTLFDSALQSFGEEIVRTYNARGLRGIRVSGRPEGDVIVLTITEGQIGDVRTITVRETGESAINAQEQQRIADAAPVQEGDLVDIERLDDFVFRLNRRPGRRVDIALAPGPDANELTLDFLISESDPLTFYFQVSNTGTEETTEIRERFGFTHYNVTNNDDAFNLDYVTGNFDEVNALQAAYERPFASGSGNKWRVYGNWVQYDASEFGFAGQTFEGESFGAGAEFIGTLHQEGPMFLDLVVGAHYAHDKVDNNLAAIEATNDFFLPYAGLRLERSTDRAETFVQAMFEMNLPDVAGTDTGQNLDGLGRLNVTDQWETLRYEASHSVFLEPILNPNWGGEGSTLAHELALSVRGQHSFGDRLPPNYVQSIGGLYTVRGYPESFSFGDNVVIGTAEYKFHLPRALEPGEPIIGAFGEPFRARPQQWLARPDWDLVFRTYIDLGTAQNEDRIAGEEDTTLLGAGVGLDFALRRNLRAQIDWAFALRDETGSDETVTSGSSQVHFLVTVLF